MDCITLSYVNRYLARQPGPYTQLLNNLNV